MRRVRTEALNPRIRHRFSHADQVAALMREDSLVAWLNPTGANRVVGNGLVGIPLRDSELQLETHLATRADNDSPLISEYVRNFVKQVKEDNAPLQLTLPME